MHESTLMEIYESLFERFGPQYWWPGDTRFEIMVGAILTQNTSWSNVEKAIARLKDANALSIERVHELAQPELAELIRPAGYYNVKAKRLKSFVDYLSVDCGGDISMLENKPTDVLRGELLSVKGIGRETADSILLYALERPIFVVDAYTARIAVRHHLIEPQAGYDELQYFFQFNLPEDLKLYNEYHALLVRLGKEFCRPKPKCPHCPLEQLPHTLECDF